MFPPVVFAYNRGIVRKQASDMAQRNPITRYLRNRFWFVHPAVTLLAKATPDETLALLATGTKPHRDRLHLQDLFADGRRYQIEKRQRGFVMHTNSKHYWRYTEGVVGIRRRTRSAAKMLATLTPIADDYTRIELLAHIRAGYFVDIFFVPGFMAVLVVLMPWVIWFQAGVIAVMVALSFAYHYYNAAYQANEMVFFVEKVLTDDLVTELPTLATENPDLMTANADFEQEWERFYSAHQPRE